MGDSSGRLPLLLAGAAGAAAGAAAAFCYLQAKPVSAPKAATGTGSTTGSTGGVALYETSKAVNEYLQFHFGADNDILPYGHGPKVRTVASVVSCLDAAPRLGHSSDVANLGFAVPAWSVDRAP